MRKASGTFIINIAKLKNKPNKRCTILSQKQYFSVQRHLIVHIWQQSIQNRLSLAKTTEPESRFSYTKFQKLFKK